MKLALKKGEEMQQEEKGERAQERDGGTGRDEVFRVR